MMKNIRKIYKFLRWLKVYILKLVESIVEEFVCKVEDEERAEVKEKKSNWQAEVISDHHERILQEQLAKKYCTSQSLVSKRLNKKDEILKEASDKSWKNLTKLWQGTKYLELYGGALLNELKKRLRCTF